MVSPSTSFLSISKISKWLVWSTVAYIIINIIFTITDYSGVMAPIEEYQNVDPKGNILIPTINRFEISSFQSVEILAFSAAAIIGLYWFYRANKNIHAFGAKEISSARMAVIWFFVPILNLWKPYKVAQQIWKASNPKTKLINGKEWKNSVSSNIIKIWWILLISTIFIKILSVVLIAYFTTLLLHELLRGSYEIGSVPSYEALTFISSFVLELSSITFMLSGIFFILVVRRVSARQKIKARKSI